MKSGPHLELRVEDGAHVGAVLLQLLDALVALACIWRKGASVCVDFFRTGCDLARAGKGTVTVKEQHKARRTSKEQEQASHTHPAAQAPCHSAAPFLLAVALAPAQVITQVFSLHITYHNSNRKVTRTPIAKQVCV